MVRKTVTGHTGGFSVGRRERKALKNLKAQRAAEEKLAAEDAKKAAREERMEQAKADWAAKSPEEKKKVYKWVGGGAAAFVVLIALSGACGGDDKKSDSNSDAAPAKEAEAPQVVKAPVVIPSPISFAEEKNGIKVDAVDLGQHIVDGVNRERGIFDRANWRIVAQCDYMVGNTMKAGVIKSDEFGVITAAEQGASIADNSFKFMLDCPAAPAGASTAQDPPPAAAPEPAPAARPDPTQAEVQLAFQEYIDERAAAGVMLAEAVTDVSVNGGVVTVVMDAPPVVLELSPYDNHAELFGIPVAFDDDEGLWLRQVVQRVDVVSAAGQSMGSMTAAELRKMGTGE
jgi:hypothetical protein